MRSTPPRFTLLRTLSLLAGLAPTLPGCAPSVGVGGGPDGDDPTSAFESTSAPLLGTVTLAADCTGDAATLAQTAAKYGRITATTNAFAECVDQAMRVGLVEAAINTDVEAFSAGPYAGCTDDPFDAVRAFETSATVVQRVVDLARSTNPVEITCTGGDPSANAWADIDVFEHAGPEALRFSTWLVDTAAQLSRGVCADTGDARGTGCRWSHAPWPFSQAAGLIWHEAMHQHGYRHGPGDVNAENQTACGIPAAAAWHYKVNTVPYIVGNCVQRVIERSAVACGNVESCGENELKLTTTYGGNTCECHHDPAMEGLGVMRLSGGRLRSQELVASGELMGGWHFDGYDEPWFAADFDGDRRDEFLITSRGWGMGTVGQDVSGRLAAEAMSSWGNTIGAWRSGPGDRYDAVGDVNLDGRADLLLHSTWGVGVLTQSGTNFSTLLAVPFGGTLGSWTVRNTDRLIGLYDFDADGRKDLLIRAADGKLAMIRLSGGVAVLATATPGVRYGTWAFSAPDAVVGVADLTGDGRAEILLRSAWGLGFLTRSAAGTLTSMNLWQNGTAVGTWTLAAGDAVTFGPDMDADGRPDLVMRSAAALGLVARSAAGALTLRNRTPMGTRLIGGWVLGMNDGLAPAGNLDANPGHELIIDSDWGVAALTFSTALGGFVSIDPRAQDHLIGDWLYQDEPVVSSPDLDGDGQREFLLFRSSPYFL